MLCFGSACKNNHNKSFVEARQIQIAHKPRFVIACIDTKFKGCLFSFPSVSFNNFFSKYINASIQFYLAETSLIMTESFFQHTRRCERCPNSRLCNITTYK